MRGQRRKVRAARSATPEIAYGVILRRLRQQAGMSQDALAAKAGYHRNYMGQLERGEKSPSLRTIFDLADALKVGAGVTVTQAERLLKRRRKLKPEGRPA